VGVNLVNVASLKWQARLHREKTPKRQHMFEDCGENSPFPPQQRFIYHSSGWDDIYGSFIHPDVW